MRRHETRLTRLEAQFIRSVVEPIALAYGIDPDALTADVRRFFALTDAEQEAHLAAAIAHAHAAGDAEHLRLLLDLHARMEANRAP
jgi:hypothetical protein